MKKIIFIFGLLFFLLTVINIIIYKGFADYDTFDFGPVVPNEEIKGSKIIVAIYKNDLGEKLIIQRYYWREEYKFIYYHPTSISDDFVVTSPKQNQILVEGEELYAIDSNRIKLVGGYNDFLNLNYLPQKLIIKKSFGNDIFQIDSIFTENLGKIPELNFWNKLTIGPILRIREF